MEVLKLENKGAYLDCYEKLHIYKAAKQGSIINETLFNQSNASLNFYNRPTSYHNSIPRE
jgi:hypothetical protein